MSGSWRDCPDPPDSDPAWEYTDADEGVTPAGSVVYCSEF